MWGLAKQERYIDLMLLPTGGEDMAAVLIGGEELWDGLAVSFMLPAGGRREVHLYS